MREEERQNQDPYTPPPRHKDKSGAVLRIALLGAMLGAAVWGYTQFADGPTLMAEPETTQQVADAGYQVAPEPIPPGAPAETATAPSAAPAPAAPAPADSAPPSTVTP